MFSCSTRRDSLREQKAESVCWQATWFSGRHEWWLSRESPPELRVEVQLGDGVWGWRPGGDGL